MPVLNKFQRIKNVRALGLNTEDSILVTPDSDFVTFFEFIIGLDQVSIRTFFPDNRPGITPHVPIIAIKDLKAKIEELHNLGLWLIIAKPIDPADCEFAGAIEKNGFNVYVELAKGPCTTRKVTHEGIIDYKFDCSLIADITNDGIDPRMLAMIAEVRLKQMA